MKIYIVLMVGFVLSGFAQNLLQNPGFEDWYQGQPQHWQGDDSILLFRDNVIVHTGNYSLKDSLFTSTQLRADLFQGYIAVQPNIQYDFHIWVWDNDSAGRIRPGIEWYPSGSYWSGNYSVDSSGWQELSFTTISPTDAESARVIIRAYDVSAYWDGGAVFYFDDAYFAPPSTQPPLILRVWHNPINPARGTTEEVYAWVTDDGTIVGDTLFYGVNSLSNPIKHIHYSVRNDTFRFHIPGASDGDTIFYFLKFFDDDSLKATSDTYAYYVGRVGIFLNEVYYDTPGSDSATFVEIYGSPGSSLDGISILGINGNGGNVYTEIPLDGYTIPQDGFFVIGDCAGVNNVDLIKPGIDLQNGPDNVQLCINNIPVDALGYGSPDGWIFSGEWLPAQDVSAGHCLGRYPDGDDTDNNAVDFKNFEVISPGEPNPAVGINHRNSSGRYYQVKNPVRSGEQFAKIIKEPGEYPISIFNVLGQRVKKIFTPAESVELSPGIYFIRTKNDYQIGKNLVVLK